MPKRVLRFHFDYISPYSYLAWQQLGDFAKEHELHVEPKPTLLAGLLNHFGHKGPAEIEPKRIYMFKDCVRAAAERGVPFAPVFSHPFNPLPSLRATLLDMEDETRERLVTDLFRATWAESRDMGSAQVVAEICTGAGVSNALERIRDPEIKQRLLQAGREAIQIGVFGVPTMIVGDELFWGTDSFSHLARYLCGADPVSSEVVEAWRAVPASAKRK